MKTIHIRQISLFVTVGLSRLRRPPETLCASFFNLLPCLMDWQLLLVLKCKLSYLTFFVAFQNYFFVSEQCPLEQWFSTFLLLRPIFSVKKSSRPTKSLIQILSIIKCFFINTNNKVKLSMIKLILMSIYQLVKLHC